MSIQRIITIAFSIIPLIAFAQTADKQAASLFSQGKYDDAAKLYDTAASTTMNDQATRQRLYELAEKCRKCSEYKKKGNSFYIDKEYSEAKSSLKELLRLNPKDKKAENLIDSCDYYISLPYVEKALWDSAMLYRTEYYFKAYLKKFPNGTHRDEANNSLDDINLWAIACEANTVNGYESYCNNSHLLFFNDEARKRIGQLREEERAKAERERLAQAERERAERERLAQAERERREAEQKRLAQEERERKEAEQKRLAQAKKEREEQERLAQAENERREKENAEKKRSFLKQARISCLDGDYSSAIWYYDHIGLSNLSSEDQENYGKCLEEIAYNDLKKATGIELESKCKRFLRVFSESKYYNAVSNKLSYYYVSQYDFNNAQKYATNEETLKYVQQSQKRYDKAAKRASIKNDDIYYGGSKRSPKVVYSASENKRWFRLGVGASCLGNEETLFWEGQALITLGSYRNYFNLDIGVDYSEGNWGVLGGLRWNMVRFESGSLYIGFQMNLFDNPELYNIEIGNREFYSEEVITIGSQGRHLDYGLFCNIKKEALGIKIIYYF